MHGIIVGIYAMVTCLCYYLLRSEKISFKKVIWIFYFILLSIASYKFMAHIIEHIQTPKIWDFTAFYLYGKVAANGYNFYLPESYRIVFDSANLPYTNFENLVEYVVNIGFLYPPPSILYFIPLGLLPYKIAGIYWTIFNLLFLIGCIHLVYSMFFKSDKLNGLILVIILFLISLTVRSTIYFSQTNFILLFYLLLMKKYYNRNFVGVFLALAIFTKPYMIIFGLFFIITRHWKAIASFILSSVMISGFTLLIIGKTTFFSYFTNNPTQRLPNGQYTEQINQSLHAVLLRANLITIEKPYLYLIIATLILTFMLTSLIYLHRRKQDDYILMVLLLVGLMIYPGTLSHYGVLTLFIIFQFFHEKQPLGLDTYFIILIVGLFYYICSFSVFSSFCFLLFIVILLVFRPYLQINSRLLNNLTNKYKL